MIQDIEGAGDPKILFQEEPILSLQNSGFWNLQMPELPFEKEARNIFAKKDFGQYRPYFYFPKIFLKHLLFYMSSQTLW